jgi:phosphoglycerate kinase
VDKAGIEGIQVRGKIVLVRVDFNVPMKDHRQITDDTRIRSALPTINYLIANGAKVILMSHLGRPKGKADPEYSLAPVAVKLGELLGKQVTMAKDCIGPEVRSEIAGLRDGDVMLLENVRFYEEEEKNDPDFAGQIAALAEIYVNDAFGAAHRAHASTEGVAKRLPSYAGFLMKKEIDEMGKALENPSRPFTSNYRGGQGHDKISVIENYWPK